MQAANQRIGIHAIRHHVLSVLNDSGKLVEEIQMGGHKRSDLKVPQTMRGLEEAVGILKS
jgi:hypothetical protein